MAIALQSQRPVALQSAPLRQIDAQRHPRELKLNSRDEWERRLTAFDAARATEQAYDDIHINPHFEGVDPDDREAWLVAAAAITTEMWQETERLQELREEAEDFLMDWPSPDAKAFAFKYLVGHGNGRETDGWDEMLEAEALRFSGRAAR